MIKLYIIEDNHFVCICLKAKIMFDIITIGTATQDIFLKSEQFKSRSDESVKTGKAMVFEAGSKMEIDEIISDTGGGATNCAVTFARLGLETATCFSLGRDAAGREIRRVLKKEGISTRIITQRTHEPTSLSIILLGPSGERTVLVHRGSLIKSPDLILDKIATKWVYISSVGGNLELLEKIATYARSRNIKLAFNPGSGELKLGLKRLFPILEATTILVLNRAEASQLMGLPYSFRKTVVRQACGLTPGIEVITDGKDGACVISEGQSYSIGVYDWPLVDRLGAGDAFGSGFVGGYIKYQDITKALQYAAANASSVVTKIGAKAGIIKAFPKKPLKVEIQKI